MLRGVDAPETGRGGDIETYSSSHDDAIRACGRARVSLCLCFLKEKGENIFKVSVSFEG